MITKEVTVSFSFKKSLGYNSVTIFHAETVTLSTTEDAEKARAQIFKKLKKLTLKQVEAIQEEYEEANK